MVLALATSAKATILPFGSNLQKILIAVGFLLLSACFLGLFGVIYYTGRFSFDLTLFVVAILGATAMFLVNIKSKDEKIVEERKWVVIVLGVFAAIRFTRLVNQVRGVNEDSVDTIYPYVAITLFNIVVTVLVVVNRNRRKND